MSAYFVIRLWPTSEAYWDLDVAGEPNRAVRARDIIALEDAFGLERTAFPGHELPRSPSEVLAESRAPAIKRFVPRLFTALDQALLDGNAAVLSTFLASDADHANAIAWLSQSLVGDADQGDQPKWNEAARDALAALVRVGTNIEFRAVHPPQAHWQARILLRRGEREAGVLLDAIGRTAVREDGKWKIVELPDSPFELVDRARHHVRVGNASKARPLLDRALSSPDIETLIAAAEVFGLLGDVERALELVQHALHRGALDAKGEFIRGTILAQAGRAKEAIAALERVEPRLPPQKRLMSRQNRATMHGRLGDAERHLAIHRENVAEFPRALHAWYAYGLACVKERRFDESIAANEELFELAPDHANGHYTIACAFSLRGNPGDDERALEHIESAIAEDDGLRAEIAEDPDFARFRADPRFMKLVTGSPESDET